MAVYRRLKSGYRTLVEGYQYYVRPYIKQSLFKTHNLTEFAAHFSAFELSILTDTKINLRTFDCLALAKTSPKSRSVPLAEAFERVGILEHTVGVLKSFQVIANAYRDNPLLRAHLRKRGNPDIAGQDGLYEAGPDFVRFNKLVKDLKQDPSFYRVFLATLWLHDIGKIIGQADHPQLSRQMIENNQELRQALSKIFSQEEMRLIAELAGNHSGLPDSVICRERNIFNVYYALLACSKDKALRVKLLKAAVLLSVADIGSYNRLTLRKIRDLIKHSEDFLKLIEQGISVISPEDLKTDEMNELVWGRMMFQSFTALEEVPQEEDELTCAYRELKRLIPSEADRSSLFRTLGRAHLVGLIFNLKREFSDPKLRTRLVVWTAKILDKYKDEADWIEFCYSRFDKIKKPKEIAFLKGLLEGGNIDEFETHLEVSVDHQRRAILVHLPG